MLSCMAKHAMKRPDGWERVGDRHNALNFIRFVLAGLVLVDHSFPITGHGEKAQIAGLGLGTWCVAGFFCLSGYLIAGSRTRTGALAYLWRRCLRIFPGLIVAVSLTAFLLAPVAARTDGAGPWSLSDAVRYVVRNALLYQPPFGIGNTLRAAPYPDAWNGSLWTLFYEFAAYLVVGALLTLPFLRRHAPALFGLLVAVTTVAAPTLHDHLTSSLYKHALFLGAFFLAGAFMWAVRPFVPLTTPLGLTATAALIVTAMLQPENATWSALPLAYVLLWLGSALPLRLFSTNDISYGMYIYAFPIQQMITVTTGNRNPYILMVSAMLATSAVAYASWRLVERPALRLKKLVR